MKLRIAPLLANKRAAPAALGLPLLLRCSAAASSLPVALAIAIAKTHRNENGITSCVSPRSTCANASSPCIILSDVTTIGYGRIRYQGLSIRMGKEEEPVWIWGPFPPLEEPANLGLHPLASTSHELSSSALTLCCRRVGDAGVARGPSGTMVVTAVRPESRAPRVGDRRRRWRPPWRRASRPWGIRGGDSVAASGVTVGLPAGGSSVVVQSRGGGTSDGGSDVRQAGVAARFAAGGGIGAMCGSRRGRRWP